MKVKILANTPNPDRVVSESAKLCYSQVGVEEIDKNLSDEQVEKFLNHLVAIGHESPTEHCTFTFAIEGISRTCYDEDTEIYTDEGWKFFKDLTGTEKILTRRQDGTVSFETPTEYISYPFNGKLHKYKSQNIDLCVTPNHNMFIKKYDVRTESDYYLIPSEDINVKRFRMTKEIIDNKDTVGYFTIPKYTYLKRVKSGKNITKTLPSLDIDSEIFIQFLAWYLSEGSVYYNEKENSYSISISQLNVSEKNNQNIKDILSLVNKMGFAEYYDGRAIRFKNSQLGLYLKTLGKSYEKYIPNEIFKNLNKHLAKLFIDTYKRADGTVDKNNCAKLYTTSKELADQLQILTFIAGYTSKMYIDNRVGESHYSEKCGTTINHNHKCYVLNISENEKNRNPVVKMNKHFSTVEYNKNVYCVNVPNHVIFVRRNGCCIWCGNCSHQVVRHRIASYSQQSQRYVKLEQFEYIIPPEIAKNEKAKKIFIEQMESSQEAYNKIVDILMLSALDNKYPNWEDECTIPSDLVNPSIEEIGDYPRIWYIDSFKELHPREYNSIEKSVIEDARYVFPNACETKMVITMNARSLMNFFKLRCCERAQWEIRDLANEMLRQVKEVAPILFKNAGAPCVRGKCPEGSMSCGNPKR